MAPTVNASAEMEVRRSVPGASVTTHTTGTRCAAARLIQGRSATGSPGATMRPCTPWASADLKSGTSPSPMRGYVANSTWIAGACGAAASRIPSRSASQKIAISRGRCTAMR